jgi:hypothetical protein
MSVAAACANTGAPERPSVDKIGTASDGCPRRVVRSLAVRRVERAKRRADSMVRRPKPLRWSHVLKKAAMGSGLSGKLFGTCIDRLMDTLSGEIKAHGKVAVGKWLRIYNHVTPAQPERTRNLPWSASPVVCKAKPEKSVLKIRALRNLKVVASLQK